MSPKTEDLRESGEAGESGMLAIVRGATGEVLETMFFSEAVPCPCDHSALDAPGAREEWISASVRFEGAPRGELSLMLSHELARFIAASFLGADPEEVSSEADSQVSCELANMICGAVLSRLHPNAGVALRPPELVPPDFGVSAGVHQCFETPDGTLAITMRLEEGREP
jgi:CheY-specific phosphatase CheX